MAKKIKIELESWSQCEDYGTVTKVNGVKLPIMNQETGTIVKKILEHIGYEVEVIETYEFD